MHPIQPLYKDEKETIRFKSNAIVRYLLDNGPFDLNHLAAQGFSREDSEQFAQLIGYSLNGFSELSYVTNDTYEAAVLMSLNLDEQTARIDMLQSKLDTIREGMRSIIPNMFQIHPDDLVE